MGVNGLPVARELSGRLVMPVVVADTDAADLTDAVFHCQSRQRVSCFSRLSDANDECVGSQGRCIAKFEAYAPGWEFRQLFQQVFPHQPSS